MRDPLLELLDEARADEAGRRRGRERVLRSQAEEDASLAGTILDLAERGTPVTVRTSEGRSHTGWIPAVGADFLVLRTEAADVFVVLAAVASLRPAAGPPATGDRPTPSDTLLLDVLATAAPSRPRVALVVAGDQISGELRAVGTDVVTIQLDGPERAPAYVSSAAVSEALLFRSG